MDLTELIGGLILVSLLSYLFIKCLRSRPNIPPGPTSMPVIGNLHLLGQYPHEDLAKLSKKYGPIYSFNFGPLKTIIISDISIAREVLIQRGPEFAGRTNFLVADITTLEGSDMTFCDYGQRWKLHRKLAHSAMRLFTERTGKMERIMTTEMLELCRKLELTETKMIHPAADIQLAAANVIYKLLFREKFERDNPNYKRMNDIVHYLMTVDLLGVYDLIPVLKWFPFKQLTLIKQRTKELHDFLYEKLRNETLELEKMSVDTAKFKQVEETRSAMENYPDDDEIKIPNYISALLMSLKNAEADNIDAANCNVTEKNLMLILSDFIFAGTETVSTTMKWCLLYMAHWPDIERNVQLELDKVIGQPTDERIIRTSDKKNLPYLEAVIRETNRLASVVPLGLFHKASKDTALQGYDIPRDTGIVINLWQLHHDDFRWKDPFEFDPQRFLDENEDISRESSMPYLPFSAGPRVCFGEAIARSELLLFLGNLLHRFSFSLPPCEEKHGFQATSGVTLCPKPFKLIIKKRY